MYISIPPKFSVSSVVGFIKGKSAISIARNFLGRTRNFTGESFWARGYFVSTVGLDEVVVREYIRNQEKEDKPAGTAQPSISYSAAVESAAHKDTDATPSVFAARVVREATRRGFDRAARQAVLGDGATWIWNLADEHFPDAVQIVDRFHANSTSRTCPSPSMPRAVTSHSSGRANAMTSWTPAISTTSSTPYEYTRRRMRRRASASATSNATASACATRSSGQQGFVPRLGSLRPAAR